MRSLHLRYPFVSGPFFLRFKSVFGLFREGRDKRNTRDSNKLMKSVAIERINLYTNYNIGMGSPRLHALIVRH